MQGHQSFDAADVSPAFSRRRFTSNHGWDDIARLLGEAVSYRLYALTMGRHVFVKAPDRRVLSVPGPIRRRTG